MNIQAEIYALIKRIRAVEGRSGERTLWQAELPGGWQVLYNAAGSSLQAAGALLHPWQGLVVHQGVPVGQFGPRDCALQGQEALFLAALGAHASGLESRPLGRAGGPAARGPAAEPAGKLVRRGRAAQHARAAVEEAAPRHAFL